MNKINNEKWKTGLLFYYEIAPGILHTNYQESSLPFYRHKTKYRKNIKQETEFHSLTADNDIHF